MVSKRGRELECQVSCWLQSYNLGPHALTSVVWVPDENLLKVANPSTHLPDETITSIEHFKPEEWGLPPYDAD